MVASAHLRVNIVTQTSESFDQQADAFDRRAGFDAAQCARIAAAAIAVAGAGARDVIVEIGAGTGQIGVALAAACRYVGVDLSAGMLERFRARASDAASACGLVRADAARAWPLASGSARAIVGSRALHLLPHDHVADEAFRVARLDGAVLVIGRVERAPESLRARLAREMRERLRRRGFAPRGDRQDRRLLDACVARGGAPLPPVTAAAWTVAASARQSLDSWRSLGRLGGIDVPHAVRDAVLADLEAWAAAAFGDIDQLIAAEEAYVLRSVRLSPRDPSSTQPEVTS